MRKYQADISTDGTRSESEYYEDGQIEKKETMYDTDGTKMVVEKWRNNNLKSWTNYDASGNMTSQRLYDEDGNLITNSDTPDEGDNSDEGGSGEGGSGEGGSGEGDNGRE